MKDRNDNMTSASYEREVYWDKRAVKEFSRFPEEVREYFRAILLQILAGEHLEFPNIRKLSKGLHELRVNHIGQWRLIITFRNNLIIVLLAFRKNTQKTPENNLKTALSRTKDYE